MSKQIDTKEWNKYRKTACIHAKQMENDFQVNTLEGMMYGHAGDYLARGIEGEEYPIKKSIFEKTYELMKE